VIHAFSSNAFFFGLEILAVVAAALAGYLFPKLQAALKVTENLLHRIARRPLWLLLTPGLVVVGGRLLLLPISPVPVPIVHDEFSYLLAGDTFAHGRLTNPPHPMWEHFETFHELQRPSYASMYPPGQGLFLAAGEVLGSPWIGVLVSVAVMCSAITWMILAILPASWALAGGLLAAIRFGLFSYWIDSYWGGAVAALGGALVFGSGMRLLKSFRTGYQLAFVAGVLLLANTRPYEGLVFCIPVFLILAVRFWHAHVGVASLARTMTPALTLAVVGLGCMSAYFWRVTGSPWTMPYQLHEKQYAITQPFIWQPELPAPHYRHAVLRAYYMPQEELYKRAHTASGWLRETGRKAVSLTMFYVWPGVTVLVITASSLWRIGPTRIAIWTLGVTFAAVACEIWPMMLHYGAPIAGPAILLVIASLRSTHSLTFKGYPVGVAVAWAVPILCILLLTVRTGAAALHVPVPETGLVPWFTVRPGNLQRARIERLLEGKPGKHLVLVHYSSNHDLSTEWVFNPAMLDESKVVWAREMTRQQDAKLFRYFRDRETWLIEPDKYPVRLSHVDTGSKRSHANSYSSR
jgi:hypothetical protein